MGLFNTTKKKKNSTLTLTPALAQEIYGAIEKNGTAQAAFLASDTNFDFSNCTLVWNELKSLEAEVMSKMSGNFVITPAIPEIKDENDKIIQEAVPAVYFKVTTQKDLAKSLESDLLDVDLLVDDCRIFSDGNPDDAPKWKDWKKSFEEVEM